MPWLRSMTLLCVKSGFEDFEGCLAALSSPGNASGSALRLTALGHTEQTLTLFPNDLSIQLAPAWLIPAIFMAFRFSWLSSLAHFSLLWYGVAGNRHKCHDFILLCAME